MTERATSTGARGRPLWGRFVALAILVVVADQLLKAWVVTGFAVGVPVDLLGDLVRIAIIHNSGALFGSFQDAAPLFAIVSVGVIALIVALHGRSGRNILLTVALGLLLGGAIGNLIDRVHYGYVVDFVDMGIGAWRFYTYNVADAAITTAIVLLIGATLFPGLARRITGDE